VWTQREDDTCQPRTEASGTQLCDTSNFQNCEKINFCPLSLCALICDTVMAAGADKCTQHTAGVKHPGGGTQHTAGDEYSHTGCDCR
jgi:hypothetical protein